MWPTPPLPPHAGHPLPPGYPVSPQPPPPEKPIPGPDPIPIGDSGWTLQWWRGTGWVIVPPDKPEEPEKPEPEPKKN